ncbi:MAG TPA: hypothetical protein IAA19_05440 [Candidatus Olsenella pullistercoris]|uniref:HpcH/HpaI aldolase/citrate lyase domain-containing protein n=1 Tax=Candidatus Olsenella pullistercoris TaxID=2838712 RepID=A0A9D2JEK8_9ACTN|nr:hypothetical protein [Candidatus Olsenella pullistercoris]
MIDVNDLVTRHLGGLLVQVIDSAPVACMAKAAGIDFLLVDNEHGDVDDARLSTLMMLGNAIGLPTIVRAPQLARADVSRLLDRGASGVMVPMMETVEQARQLADWAKYPPLGRRSYSGGAHTAYGPSGHHAENMARANAGTLAIAQIETVAGVERAREILSVPGIDAAVIGPCDLAISMGRPDEVGCPEELELIDRVRDACAETGKGFGIIGGNALMKRYAQDINLMVSAIDVHILRDAFAAAASDYRSISALA